MSQGKFSHLEALVGSQTNRDDGDQAASVTLVDPVEAASESAVEGLTRALTENPVRAKHAATVAVAFRLARTLDAMPADADPGKVAYLSTSYAAVLKQLGLVWKA